MKKGVLIIVLVFLLSFVISVVSVSAASQADQGFSCLANQTTNCTSLTSIGEKIFTSLATGRCTSYVANSSQANGCWVSPQTGSCDIKTTSEAMWDLIERDSSANLTNSTSWLISQNQTTTDLNWYLQIDSNYATLCNVSYSDPSTGTWSSNSVNISKDKIIQDPSAGSCLLKSSNGYWLHVLPSCFGTQFSISCNQGFTVTKLYRKNPPDAYNTTYVSGSSRNEPSGATLLTSVNSYCFGTGSSCDYESTLWASLILDRLGYDVSSYLPYLTVEAGDSANSQYMPYSFLYMLTHSSDYLTNMLNRVTIVDTGSSVQKFWRYSGDPYFGTSLAILTLKVSSDSTDLQSALNYVNQNQDTNGCWNNGNLLNTAFVLYSAFGPRTIPIPTSPTTGCTTDADCSSGSVCVNGSCIVNETTTYCQPVYSSWGSSSVTQGNTVSLSVQGSNCANTNIDFMIKDSSGTTILEKSSPTTSILWNTSSHLGTFTFTATALDSGGSSINSGDGGGISTIVVNPPSTVTGNCQLTNASWGSSSVTEGDNVSLSIQGSNCGSTTFNFTIKSSSGTVVWKKTSTPASVLWNTSGHTGSYTFTATALDSGGSSINSGTGNGIGTLTVTVPSSGTTTTKDCSGAGYYCLSTLSCTQDAGGTVLPDYSVSCPGIQICCSKNIVAQTCSDQKGTLCSSTQICSSSVVSSSDSTSSQFCCLGQCTTPTTTSSSTCTDSGGTCRNACLSNEGVLSSATCDSSSQVCCTPSVEQSQGVSKNIVWIIILSVLIVLAALAIIFRKKLSKIFKSKKSGQGSKGQPSFGPRGPFPPRGPPTFQRRPMSRPRPPANGNDVIRKLREMGK